MNVVGRGMGDGFDRWILHDRVVAVGLGAAVFRRKGRALIGRARKAGRDIEQIRTLAGIGQNVRPPANTQNSNTQRLHRLLLFSGSCATAAMHSHRGGAVSKGLIWIQWPPPLPSKSAPSAEYRRQRSCADGPGRAPPSAAPCRQ